MRTTHRGWLSALTSMTLLFWAVASLPVAHAADIRTENRAFGGAMLGASSVDNDVGTGFGFGLDGGYFVNSSWGIGAMIRSANHAHDVTQFTYAAEGLYRFGESLPGLFAGAMLGASKFSVSGAPNNGFNITFGVKAGFDYPVSSTYPVTVGVDLSLNWVKPADTMLTDFTPFATLKWWF